MRNAHPRKRRATRWALRTYWYPLYAFVRRQGYSADDAHDLTQGFFTVLLERDYLQDVRPDAGRFRHFMLASLRHYLSKEREKNLAIKRGGGTTVISIDARLAEERYGVDRSKRHARGRLRASLGADGARARPHTAARRGGGAGRARSFRAPRPYLTGSEPQAPYRDVAAALAMSEGAVKTAVHRLRRRFGTLLRAEIAETVSKPEQVDDEVRHLLSAVRPWEPP